MSFGGFGGFGQNNQQSSGFGTGTGFGGTSTGGGFGSTASASPFGSSNTTSGGLFGGSSGGFGSGGGFGTGTQSNSLFGNQNRTGGFGTTTTSAGGSLFGGGTTTAGGTGFGGFGSTGNTGSGFGSTGTGGGLFGNKTGFGTATTGTGFGTGSGFGANATPSGFGGAGGTAFQGQLPPCEGTGGTPFNPVQEKDTSANVNNHYQSITFQQPYQKYSFEELRLADYNQGRRFGNGSGQAGAFGTSAFGGSGFGQPASTGFGSAASPFGAATSAPSAFGQTQTTGGFGSASTNPLFGASKPATSLFGGGTTGTSQPSLFGGTTGTTGGGFGATGATGTGGFGTGSSLFGGNQQQQNKPLFGGTTGTGGFGSSGFGQQTSTTTTAAANPFGTTTATSSPFGGTQQTGTGFGGFGQQNQTQTQNKGLFGGLGSTGTQQQQTTPSLFGGGANTGTSAFSGQMALPQQQPSTSLFGGNTQQTGSTSLFGGGQQQQNKPLFGGPTGTGTGGSSYSIFGNPPNQPTGGTGSFGQNQPQQKSLFGGGGTGNSLFGGQNPTTQNTGSSLFGGLSQNQQPQAGGMGASSLFGVSQQPQQQQQQHPPVPGSLQTSLLEGNPYGNQSIFSGLPGPNAPSPGPLATPLSSTAKQKQRTPLPVYKITPNAANRLITPPKRQGYGFSYSAYGSPTSSISSAGGLGSSLLGSSLHGSVNGGLGHGLSRSFSATSATGLRKSFDPEADSILSPGALSSTGTRPSSNLKRLTIDRNLRSDLFSRPASTPAATITNGEDSTQQAKKRVSFDATATTDVPDVNGREVVLSETQSADPTPEELGFLRSVRRDNAPKGAVNGTKPAAQPSESIARPEMENIQEKAVPTETEHIHTNGQPRYTPTPGRDPKPGDYWMKPSREELDKMPREQLKHFVGFTVGREFCGQVTFDRPVDLTTIDMDRVLGGLVLIGLRSITVYPDGTVKPLVGKGLNVPSTLTLENSWPRGRDKRSGLQFDKHIDRLKKVNNTEFVDYNKSTATWTFRVAHYTTYGFDYDDDDDDDDEGESLNQSALSVAPDTPTPNTQSSTHLGRTVDSEPTATFSTDDSFVGSMAGVNDDTFDFKKRKIIPGSFANQAMVAEDDMEEDNQPSGSDDEESFLGEGSTGSTTEEEGDDVTESQQSGDSEVESDGDEEMEMAGSFPNLRQTVERDDTKTTEIKEPVQLILKPYSTPSKAHLDLSGDWTEHLQRTISPRKQNRDALREIQANAFTDRLLHSATPRQNAMDVHPKKFTSSIDLMNSLFQQPRKQTAQAKGFEWPYPKQPKTFAGDSNGLGEVDTAFHLSFKPRWGPMDSIICVKNGMRETLPDADKPWEQGISITSEERDIVVLSFNKTVESRDMLDVQRKQSAIQRVDGVPFARLVKTDFKQFTRSPQSDSERLVWLLAAILFDEDMNDDISDSVPAQLRPKLIHRIKKDRLSRLWAEIIRERHAHDLSKFGSLEERAILLLCSHRVDEACKTLIKSGNLHLASLVSQIGRDPTTRADMEKQIEYWREHNVYSEMTDPIRALYELLAGNALLSEGKSGGVLEDRASTFTLTERFELDWFQAFGLRLWYGITDDEPIEVAVSKFAADLASGQELAFPYPEHAEEDCEVAQPGSDTLGRESPLWVLLKVYSAFVSSERAPGLSTLEFPAAVLPESVSEDRLTNRLSFQLHHTLSATIGQQRSFRTNAVQADHLVRDYAWELASNGELEQALFVLLHLSRASDRERAVKDTLARFAPRLPSPVTAEGSPDATWQYLTVDLQLPEAWIWVAKALYARYTGDATGEVDCLIRGKNWNDAHATFCRIVGPTAVIERDYDTLEKLISGFGDAPERKVRGWDNGGGVYDDFLHVATARGGKRDSTRLNRLARALVSLGHQLNQKHGVEGLEERVAFQEMSNAIAKWTSQEDIESVDTSTILNLPLSGNTRVTQTVELSRRYYNVIMAGAY